ncbi:hypothetical protein [Neobacillus sp. DY30]|uniref:hypothetical protein n=1 Tax=Neobacillus sp. DY30 TaxID=3047871 RepID=UPI0024C040DA|nr:hypothetical protein [Neobacillus sp. DY30]WHX98037.1 hypothetical protein QNH29_15275 [Neobacillus sp. DY30]
MSVAEYESQDHTFGGNFVNKDQLEVIKVGSLAVIAISLVIIAWKMEKVVKLLHDLVIVSGNQ